MIFHAVKGAKKSGTVVVSSSTGPDDEHRTLREVDYNQVVRPNDPDSFIHIVPDDLSRQFAERMTRFTASLSDLGLAVSTGRVVDFRAKHFLRLRAGKDTVPLIYPCHFTSGFVKWPNEKTKKPNALAVVSSRAEELLVPADTYVLVKRVSAREEPRRVVAAIYDPGRVSASRVMVTVGTGSADRRADRRTPQSARVAVPSRPLIADALAGDMESLEAALAGEERLERDRDQRYWQPLRKELEQLRHQRG